MENIKQHFKEHLLSAEHLFNSLGGVLKQDAFCKILFCNVVVLYFSLKILNNACDRVHSLQSFRSPTFRLFDHK